MDEYQKIVKTILASLHGYPLLPWKFDNKLFPHKPDITADTIHEMLQLRGTDGEGGKRIEVAVPPVHSRERCFVISLQATESSPDIFNLLGYRLIAVPDLRNEVFSPELLNEALAYPKQNGYSGFRDYKLCGVQWDEEVDEGSAWVVWTGDQPPTTSEEWDDAIIYVTADPVEGQELRAYMGKDRWTCSRCICQNCDGVKEVLCGRCRECNQKLELWLWDFRPKPLPSKLKQALKDQFPGYADVVP